MIIVILADNEKICKLYVRSEGRVMTEPDNDEAEDGTAHVEHDHGEIEPEGGWPDA